MRTVDASIKAERGRWQRGRVCRGYGAGEFEAKGERGTVEGGVVLVFASSLEG